MIHRVSLRQFAASVLAIGWCLAGTAMADASSRLSTRFLARGEKALLEVIVTGSQPAEIPIIPKNKDVEIQVAGRGTLRAIPGRKLEYVMPFLVSSYTMGKHTLPGFDVTSGGVTSRTEPIEFTVFDPSDLEWNESTAGGKPFRYASTFKTLNNQPYLGETTPVEIKLYIPQDQFVEDWGNPEFQRVGVTAWRFQASSMRGEVNLLGKPYFSVAYPSTLTPTRTGEVSIGPASVRLMTIQVVLDGIQRRVAEEINLRVPALHLTSRPLPAGAPDGFENAIGNFSLNVSTSNTDVQEGDPIAVDIVVRGSGNLDTLRPPKPASTEGWKCYDATSDLRGDERRELSGMTVFHQFLRPLEIKPEIPSFRLVFFDPARKTYETITSDPIPLQMRPATNPGTTVNTPPKALPVPVEKMTDILAPVETENLTKPTTEPSRDWILHGLGAAIACILCIKALWMRNAHRFRKDPVRQRKIAALRDFENHKSANDREFLIEAGKLIEHHMPDASSQEIRDILAERDSKCFLKQQSDAFLTTQRRAEILRILRKSMLVLAWMLMAPFHADAGENRAQAARDAYQSANYDEAAALWLNAGPYESLTADTLYNIGNACYRSGYPGQAALYFRRAIHRGQGHQEAMQNLRFLERKYGSITIHRPEYQYALSKVPLSTWKSLTWAGLWMLGLSILVFPATRPGSRLRVPAIIAMVAGPLLSCLTAMGWRYFPTDAQFVPVERQAVVVGDKVTVHTEASRTSPEVIDAPQGSLCEVVRESGRWTYVAFASKTRGWVPSEFIDKIIPDSPPSPPKIRKAKATGKSA